MWNENVGNILGGGRLKSGLLVPPPPSDVSFIDAANAFVISELKKHGDCKGLVLLDPGWDGEKLLHLLANPQIVGIKPFSTFGSHTPAWQAPLAAYLPDWAWQIADQHGLIILAHLVMDKALSDPGNYREINEKCSKYPHAKLLLDHAARGFHAPNTVKGVKLIRDLKNVWFDVSCICEAEPLYAILEAFGHKRLLYGSDFPLSQHRGKAITCGTGFLWLGETNYNWDSYKDMCFPTLLGLESLRAVKTALTLCGTSRIQTEDIFWNNAVCEFVGE